MASTISFAGNQSVQLLLNDSIIRAELFFLGLILVELHLKIVNHALTLDSSKLACVHIQSSLERNGFDLLDRDRPFSAAQPQDKMEIVAILVLAAFNSIISEVA